MDEIVKAAGLFFGFLGAIKLSEDAIGRRFLSRKEAFEFSKNYLDSLEKGELSTLSKEKGFYALSGRICDVSEINYLLALPSPSRVIEETRVIAKFIQFSDSSAEYEWRGIYQNPVVRALIDMAWLSGAIIYVILMGLSLFKDDQYVSFIGNVGSFVVFGVGMAWCYFSYGDGRKAQRFMRRQRAKWSE